MTWCQSCGEQYEGSTHNCGVARIANDELERLRKIEAAAQLMLDSMDYELDLSDVTVLEQAEWSELVGCTRPANVWRLVKHSTENLREALGEPSDAQ